MVIDTCLPFSNSADSFGLALCGLIVASSIKDGVLRGRKSTADAMSSRWLRREQGCSMGDDEQDASGRKLTDVMSCCLLNAKEWD